MSDDATRPPPPSPDVGDPAPDFAVLRPDGSAARLGDFPDRPLLLIFLRHLA
jgi:peroxiredoxin